MAFQNNGGFGYLLAGAGLLANLAAAELLNAAADGNPVTVGELMARDGGTAAAGLSVGSFALGLLVGCSALVCCLMLCAVVLCVIAAAASYGAAQGCLDMFAKNYKS